MTEKYEPDYTSIVVVVVFLIMVIFAYFLSPNRQYEQKKPVVQKQEFNWTNAGEKVGRNTGRTTRGFFRGLWNSNDNK